MTKRAQDRGSEEPRVKTSLQLPESLWKAVKVRAAEERRGFRSLVIAALEAYLKLRQKES
jgi:hypothetical protein